MVFETERLIVRQWAAGDLDRLFDIYSRWEVARRLGAVPQVLESREEAAGRLERIRQRSADPRYGMWAVEIKETGVVAGSVLLVPFPDQPGPEEEVEVGWHLHPDSWGHGYATEAARGALAKGFGEGLTVIHAVTYPDNGPSQAVCARLGMQPLGLTDRWYGRPLTAYRLERPTA
ncbi:N-acetyltransferase [Kitasatospora sp. MMS16-BH015]|uniref:GNAT family N-acetyltransferase n=1 Tax=Kitasatospora sp. MMS16-BH015 TaxID=2018025 RepID=UPI000CA32A5C|nr:GNAT family N-acetyltransferase [Kitasatospora sp. MMS16-BH015]AUG76623.1 N-acetyltransferase [Kitasatospora sp. MMS16-BH015]